MVIAGTFLGDIVSLFPDKVQPVFAFMPGRLILILYGLLTGMYVGCLALSIAEIMDAIPIMARRVRLRRGIGIVIIHFALGKLVGSLLYYKWHIFNW
jgi:stage V sporulation protein AB